MKLSIFNTLLFESKALDFINNHCNEQVRYNCITNLENYLNFRETKRVETRVSSGLNYKGFIADNFPDVPVNVAQIARIIRLIDKDPSITRDPNPKEYLSEVQFNKFKDAYLSAREEKTYVIFNNVEDVPPTLQNKIINTGDEVSVELTKFQAAVLAQLHSMYRTVDDISDFKDSLKTLIKRNTVDTKILGYTVDALVNIKPKTLIKKVFERKGTSTALNNVLNDITDFEKNYLTAPDEMLVDYKNIMSELMNILLEEKTELSETYKDYLSKSSLRNIFMEFFETVKSADISLGSFFTLGTYLEYTKDMKLGKFHSYVDSYNSLRALLDQFRNEDESINWQRMESNFNTNWHKHYRMAIIYYLYLILNAEEIKLQKLDDLNNSSTLNSVQDIIELAALNVTGVSTNMFYEILSIYKDGIDFSLLSENVKASAIIDVSRKPVIKFLTQYLKHFIINEKSLHKGGVVDA